MHYALLPLLLAARCLLLGGEMKHSGMSEDEVARYWDENADSWSDQVRKGWDYYREYLNNPAFLRFIGDRRARGCWMPAAARATIRGCWPGAARE